jgi:Tol biopolymer transport system component
VGPIGHRAGLDQSSSGCDANTSAIYTTDLQGNLTLVTTAAYYAQYPSYSPDGAWIYFSSNTGSSGSLWRVHPDGTGPDTLNTAEPGFDLYASASPNGTQLVYATLTGSSDLRILTLSSGAVTDLNISGWAPSWSPAGNQIAYLQGFACQSTIGIANADGTNPHRLTQATYQGPFDWSPDGQWLVAFNVGTGVVDLISPSTGATFPLPFTSGLTSPSWQPGSSTSGARVARRSTRPRM